MICRLIKTMSSVAKKAKLKRDSGHVSTEDSKSLLQTLQLTREKAAKSVTDFDFNKKRLKILSVAENVPEYCEGIVYWMSRDCRVQDNWALLFAQKLAFKNQVPLHVCFCLNEKYSALRHYHFLLQGLEKVSVECRELDIPFHVLRCAEMLPNWVEEKKIGAVVCDFAPLRFYITLVESLKGALKKDVPLIQVDAHNIVPCWIASDKQEYSARTIRNKINSKLDDFLTEFPPVVKHPYKSTIETELINWEHTMSLVQCDHNVQPVQWAKAGYDEGIRMLQHFLDNKLKYYASKRNDPTEYATSNLSPWFNFGQISVQRAVLSVQVYKEKYRESVNSFLEEAIIRRELADNFCMYNEHYDAVKGASEWARTTLDQHRKDKRTWIYTIDQLRESETHDDLWNAAQKQLVIEGKMHGFLRMYWCKKILEWSASPEDALKFALHLNDHYSLDGVDPNGYVGCMWSICGVHDQGWASRDIFGKIRYMNYAGCKRKFDVGAFVARYAKDAAPKADTNSSSPKKTKAKKRK